MSVSSPPLTFGQNSTLEEPLNTFVNDVLDELMNQVAAGIMQEPILEFIARMELGIAFATLAYMGLIEDKISSIDVETERTKCAAFIEDFMLHKFGINAPPEAAEEPLGISLVDNFDFYKVNGVWQNHRDFLKSLAHLAAAEDYNENILLKIGNENQTQFNAILDELLETFSQKQSTPEDPVNVKKNLFNAENQSNNVEVLCAFFKEVESQKLEAIPEELTPPQTPSSSSNPAPKMTF